MKTVDTSLIVLSPSESQCLKGGAGPGKPRPPILDFVRESK